MGERRRIGLRDVREIQPGRELWDVLVSGFGVRRQQSEAVAYVLLYRTREGRQRRLTIGRHGAPWTPDTARDEARRLLGEVARGNDPAGEKSSARKAETVADLCDAYLADAEAGRLLTRRGSAKKESTLISDRGRIAGHIKPLLGRLAVAAVTRDDVEVFMHAVAEGKTATRTKTARKGGMSNLQGGRGVATRTVGLLGGIFTYAEKKRLRSDNPVRGVIRFADQQKKRRLSIREYAAIGFALQDAAASSWPPAIAATRFLLMTGWRSGEATGLRWDELDLDRNTTALPDTKTGRSVRPLAQPVCTLLRELPRMGPLVFPSSRGSGRMTGYTKIWKRIMGPRGVSAEITPHVLRHSFASLAADLGYSELTIAALICHEGQSITSRYVHSADAVLLAAANAVARRTEELIG